MARHDASAIILPGRAGCWSANPRRSVIRPLPLHTGSDILRGQMAGMKSQPAIKDKNIRFNGKCVLTGEVRHTIFEKKL